MNCIKKAKIKGQIQQIIIKKNEEYKEQLDMSKCTFKPKLNRQVINKENENIFNENGVYERNFNFLKKKDEKLEKFKAERDKKVERFTYMPNVSANKNEDFFKKSCVNNFSTKNFLVRMNKARVKKQEVEQPQKKINTKLNMSLVSNRKYMNKSASCDSSLIYVNEPVPFNNIVHNLHYDLLNFDLNIE